MPELGRRFVIANGLARKGRKTEILI